MSEPLALLLSLAFGILYNLWISYEARRLPPDHGLTAFQVVVGVGGVLLLSSLVNDAWGDLAVFWQGKALPLTNAQHAAWFELKFFAAAGLPMVLGSLWRFWQRTPWYI